MQASTGARNKPMRQARNAVRLDQRIVVGQGRGGDAAVYEPREAPRPITFYANDRFPQPRPWGLPVTMAASPPRRSA